MKRNAIPLLVTPILSLLLTACPTTDTQPAEHHRSAATNGSANRSADNEETEPSKIRPHKGMTKAQVRKLYGDPDNQQVTSSGETWSYFFNKGHYFIPYYFGRPRTGTFHFNEAGIPFCLPHELGQLALAFVKPFSRCAIFSPKMKS